MMTNERKAELLRKLRKIVNIKWLELFECNTDEETEFLLFEDKRLLADLDYSINYYEEHKYDTK